LTVQLEVRTFFVVVAGNRGNTVHVTPHTRACWRQLPNLDEARLLPSTTNIRLGHRGTTLIYDFNVGGCPPWPPQILYLPPTTPAYTNNHNHLIRCPDPRFRAPVPDGSLPLSTLATNPGQRLGTTQATALMRRFQSRSSAPPSRRF
jgi:hypothetical protein